MVTSDRAAPEDLEASQRDRRLADLLVERGLVGSDEIARWLESTSPGGLAPRLVSEGVIPGRLLARLERDLDVLEQVGPPDDSTLPSDVRARAGDPRACFGRYVLVSKLGQGGMGEVWKAYDRSLARWVALKFLLVPDPDLVPRFLREAALAAELSHPNVAQVYDVGAHDERVFLAMHYVEGESLQGRTLDRRRAVEVVRDAARGVAHAHARGIVHRDVKPANLIEMPDGQVVVTDFGLARRIDDGSNLTVTGEVLGTPSFMAPEQARGASADARTDVYGLGATLFALVEGRIPYTGPGPVEVLRLVAAGRFPRLAGTDDLVWIVARATERQPDDRYSSAEALLDDLDRYLDGRTVAAHRVGVLERARRFARRRPAIAAALVVLFALAVAGAVLGAGALRALAARRTEVARADGYLGKARAVLEEVQRLEAADQEGTPGMDRAVADLGRLAEDAVRAAPDYPPALRMRARSEGFAGRHAEAETDWTRVLLLDPTDDDAHGRRAIARVFQVPDVIPSAVATAKSMKFTPTPPPDAKRALLAGAEADAAALPADHPLRARVEGMLAYLRGDAKTAIALLEKPLAEQPYLWRERLLLANALLLDGDFERAGAEAAKLVDAHLGGMSALSVRGYARGGLGDFAGAVADMTEVLKQHPDWSSQRHFRAFWQFQLGRTEASLSDYDRVLRDEPDDVDALLGRSGALAAAQRTDEARRDVDRAVELAPDDARAWYERGNAWAGTEEAVRSFTKALALDDSLNEARGQRAYTAFLMGRYEDAARDGLEAARKEPDYGPWHFVAGASLVYVERYAEALPELDRAIAWKPENGYAFLLRALARSYVGSCDGARADLDRARELDAPLDPDMVKQIEKSCPR